LKPSVHSELTSERWAAFAASQSLFSSSPIPGIELFELPDFSKIHPSQDALLMRPQGKQMEALLALAIAADERYELLKHGLQVADHGITIGELDFLIYDHKNSKVLHVELAYKYYIHDRQEGAGLFEPWIGPGRKDKMNWKLEQLAQRSFPLLHHPLTKPLLKELDIDPEKIEQRLCFLGELFLAEGETSWDDTILNHKSHAGTWMSLENFLAKDWGNQAFSIPLKQDWILPYNPTNTFTEAETKKSVKGFLETGKVPMLKFKKEGENQSMLITRE
jgi:uncharacterized protein